MQYGEKHVKDFNPKKYSKLSVKNYLEKLRQQISHEDSVLSVFREKHQPTGEFATWAKNHITYQNANYLIHYNYYNRDLKHEESRVLYDKTLFPVSNDDAFVSRLYALHLRHYASHKYYRADSVQTLLDNNQHEMAHRRCLNQILKHEEPGLSREVMCYKVLSFIDEEEHFDAFSSIWKDRKKFITNEVLLPLLEEDLLVEIRNQKSQKQVKDKKNTGSHISYVKYQSIEQGKITGDLSDYFAEKYKGKVIYIDIWATWCGPCRSEFPHMIDLHEQYKDEPVVFVSLCLASNRSDWKEAIKNQHIPGERYYFSKTQTKRLRNKLDFVGYPTYMLIDRKGNLVDKQAPRPSSEEKIKKMLDKLVEN
jgi:thiol-disulfide isomerase/thioredoxin